MSDLIRREDVFEALGITDKSTKYGGDHSGYNTLMLYEIKGAIDSIPTAEPTIDDIAERISNTDWYHIFKGELRQGAHDREEALFKAEDIFNVLKDMGASEEYAD